MWKKEREKSHPFGQVVVVVVTIVIFMILIGLALVIYNNSNNSVSNNNNNTFRSVNKIIVDIHYSRFILLTECYLEILKHTPKWQLIKGHQSIGQDWITFALSDLCGNPVTFWLQVSFYMHMVKDTVWL